jgi:hypothetical protein
MKNRIAMILKPLAAITACALAAGSLWTAFTPKARAESCEDWCIRQRDESVSRCWKRHKDGGKAFRQCLDDAERELDNCKKVRCKDIPE